ncbi:ATP-binding protein [Bradyrhizobium archetypum]|uniref:histidine kinase n=1 Tax=Bradyrhizobium archetypum TaxID=2721160 RepID=A0A7Y4H1N0_9BRAD|nr:ATP-binding protein [Bradyrhizobium archetypum]NOJ45981.1 two-component sensor histidine kinase [Bradyrhizobium archetypum]
MQFVRSNTFHWAAALAGLFAAFVTILFGFIYFKIDSYLIARSDRMITTQVNFFAALPLDRLIAALDDHLGQDSRGVQFAGVFDAKGSRLAGNVAGLPGGLEIGAPVKSVRLSRVDDKEVNVPLVRAVARALDHGNVLVIGRNVDETGEISRVVGGALAFGLLPAFCFWLLAGAWLSVRAQRRVEEVNLRVQRIIAGDLRERLPHGNIDEPFSRLAAIVNGMLDELETTINALAGVGNDIAHDLRTPLTRARLTLERGRTNATSLERLQETTDKAIAGIDQSLSIVTALLRLAEIESSRRSSAFGRVALDEMLREVCDMYEPIAEDKHIALNVDTSGKLYVHGDRDLLLEAVANLVDNAIKFTPENGAVRLDLLRGQGETILRVTDTGPGISDQEHDAVLRRFYRSDKIRNTPGVGLGLNLVSAIVKLHGFRLIIHSGPGGRVEIICPDEQAGRR